MNKFIKLSRTVVTMTLFTVGLSACASLDIFSDKVPPTDNVSVSTVAEPRGQDVWRSGHQYVKLVNKGRGSTRNDHPVNLSSTDVKALFSSISVSGGLIIKRDDKPVFSTGELQVLSVAIAKSLVGAEADEDVTFATVGLHSAAFDKEKKATSGRAFVREGNLHIIFGLLHDDYEGALIGGDAKQSAHLAAGIRLAEADLNSSLVLNPGQTFHRDPKTGDKREDWLVVDIETVLAGSGQQGLRSRSLVSSELLQDVAQSKKEADSIKEDISKIKEVIFELTDEVERLRREVETLKQGR